MNVRADNVFHFSDGLANHILPESFRVQQRKNADRQRRDDHDQQRRCDNDDSLPVPAVPRVLRVVKKVWW
jgi:hypothetical protein